MTIVAADVVCPACSAPRVVGHPAGVCTFSHASGCPIGAAEDSRRAADFDWFRREKWRPAIGYGQRDASATEIQLLGAMNVFPPPPITIVTAITSGAAVLCRSWLGVEELEGA